MRLGSSLIDLDFFCAYELEPLFLLQLRVKSRVAYCDHQNLSAVEMGSQIFQI